MSNKPLAHVYIITYDHLGIVLWKLDAVQRVLDEELTRLEKYPDFKVGWDHEAFTYDYLAEYEPAFFEQMKQALARFPDRLGVGTCTYGQPLAQFINEESNVRQLTMALDTVEHHLNRKVSVYFMSEHAMHSQIPQLIASCGFKGAIMRTHFMMFGYNPTIEAPVVWWVGLDGSHTLTLPTYPDDAVAVVQSGQFPFGAVTFDSRVLTDYPGFPETLDAFRRHYGGRIHPLVATRADDPRQSEAIVAAHSGNPDYTWILAEEVFNFLPQPRLDFQPAPNDFKVRMPWGLRGGWIQRHTRQAEASVLTAERLAALHVALGGSDHQQELTKSWKNLLVGQHHDIQIVGIEDDAHIYLDASLKQSTHVIQKCMQALAKRVGIENQAESRYVIFNPLPWARTDWVETPDDFGLLASLPGLGLRSTPARVPSHSDVSPLKWMPEKRLLRTPKWEFRLGEKGGLEQWTNRQTGELYLNPAHISGTLVGWIDGQQQESWGKSEVRIEEERAVILETGQIGSIPYRMEWSVYTRLDRVDWHCEVDLHGEKIGRLSDDPRDPYSGFEHEYKLRLRFYPHLMQDAIGIRDLPFAISETDQLYVEGNYWTAVSDGKIGLALFNRGLMGSIRESDGAFSVPLAFSMYYIWTNPEHDHHLLKGTFQYELAALPFRGSWHQVDLHRRALEYNFPCQAVLSNELRDPVGDVWAPFEIEGDGEALLSALYHRHGQMYARFYEYGGHTANVSVIWLGKPIEFAEVNLRDQAMGVIGRNLPLGAWQIRTVRLESGL